MDATIVWTSKDGRVRIVECWHENDDGDYSSLHAEQIQRHARMGEPIWSELKENGILGRLILPEEYLKELLGQCSLRSTDGD